MRDISEEIKAFVDSIADLWMNEEALDGDDTEAIAQQVLSVLDQINGNVSDDERDLYGEMDRAWEALSQLQGEMNDLKKK